MKIMYVHCEWRNEYRSDPRSYEHYWTSSWNKPEKFGRALHRYRKRHEFKSRKGPECFFHVG